VHCEKSNLIILGCNSCHDLCKKSKFGTRLSGILKVKNRTVEILQRKWSLGNMRIMWGCERQALRYLLRFNCESKIIWRYLTLEVGT
jgi:hypothetical protein